MGTFPAAVLAGLESKVGAPIGQFFDLIAGTSTGGILAISLAMGIPAHKLLELYQRLGPQVLSQDRGKFRRLFRTISRTYKPKYNHVELRTALSTTLGDKRIGDADTRLVIPAWNPVARQVHIYKTAHDKRLTTDYKCLAIDAALATASAPSYFPRYYTDQSIGLVDGGIWANNPIGIAAVEAIALLKWPSSSIRILSLGCLNESYTISSQAGLFSLGKNLIRLFMDGQSQGALGMAKLLTGHDELQKTIFRIDHLVEKGSRRFDDPDLIQDLTGLGYTKARASEPMLVPVFFDSPAKPFSPYFTLNKDNEND